MVISALENVAIVSKGVHTKFAKIGVVAFSFACTVAEQNAMSLVLLASVHAAVGALMISANSIVQSHVDHADNPANGIVLITSATIVVVKNAIALVAMLPVLKSFLAATLVLVCVEKTALLCVPFAKLKSSLS